MAERATQTAGTAIGLAGLALFAATIFVYLPPIPFGIFDRLETTGVALFAAGALCALGLALAGARARARAWRAPLFAAFACVGLWSAASAPLAEFPWNALLEQGRSGQGALLLLGFAAAAGAACAFAGRRARAALAVLLALGALAACAAQIWGPGVWRPWRVPALLAWLGLAAFLAMAVTRPFGRASLPAASIVLALALAVSENRSAAGAAVALGVPLFLAARWALARWPAARVRAIGAAVVVLLAPAATAAIWALGEAGMGLSIVERARIYDVLWAAFLDRPWTLVLGNGWGASLEAFFRHLGAADTALNDDGWDMAKREFGSAHNFVFEFWFAAGLPGLALGLALPALTIWRARRRDLPAAIAYAAVFAAGSTFWHHESYAWGATIVALALAARRPWRIRAAPAQAWRAGALAGGFALAAASVWQFASARQAGAALAAEPPAACLEDFPGDGWRGQFGWRVALGRIVESGEAAPARLTAGLCALERRFAAGPTLHVAVAGLDYFGRAYVDPAVRLLPLARWPDYLDAALRLAPRRTDLATAYLAHLIQEDRWDALAAYADAMVARSPDDPVGLWFSGLARTRTGDPAARRTGIERMRRALDLGFERIVPLPEEVVRAVREAR